MKRIFSSLLVLALFTQGAVAALAHGPETEAIASAPTGVLPDNLLFIIDRLFEKLGDALTLSAASKTNRLIDHAEERLVEYSILIERGKLPHAQKALTLYEEHITKAAKLLDSAKNKDAKGAQLANKIMAHQEVLAGVYAKVPEAAHEGIRNAIEASQKSYEKTIGHLSETKQKELKEIKELYDREVRELLAPDREIVQPPPPTPED